MKRRVLSVLLSLCLVLSLLPTAAFAQGKSYVALGDSITTGYGLTDEENDSFAALVANENGYELTNLAQDGATSGDLLEVVQDEENSDILQNADLITITIGGNDLMGALYQYLADAYNAANDTDISANDVQDALAGTSSEINQTTMLTFAAGVITDFADSDAATAALQNFGSNLAQIISAIKSANQDVTIIVANQYNPYSYAAKEAIEVAAFFAPTVEAAFEAGVKALNEVIGASTAYYEVADVYTAFKGAADNPCNAYFISTTDMDLDFHPNAYGHELMAEVIGGLLEEGGDIGTVEPEPQVDSLYVNGENILEAPDYTVQCGSGEASYDVATNTLTLNNATITNAKPATESSEIRVGIYAVGNLTIVLEGNNTFADGFDMAVWVDEGELIIDGSGSLDANVTKMAIMSDEDMTIRGGQIDVSTSGDSYSDFCIFSRDRIIIEGTPTIYASAKVTGAIHANRDITVGGVEYFVNSSGEELLSIEIVDGEVVSGLHTATVYVNGVDMSDTTFMTLGDGWASYDPDSGTLTLHDAEITEPYIYSHPWYYEDPDTIVGIYADVDLTIVLEGENTIQFSDLDCALYTQKSVTVLGEGSLSANSNSYGIYSNGGITIEDTTVTLYGESYGIYADESDLNITNSNVTIDTDGIGLSAPTVYIMGSTVNVTTKEMTVNNKGQSDGQLIIGGDTSQVTLVSEGWLAVSVSNMTITGGTVEVTSASGTGVIVVNGLLTVTGGKLTAIGEGRGIWADMIVKGGTVVAIGRGEYSYGLLGDKLTMKGDGTLYASGTQVAIFMENKPDLPDSYLPAGYHIEKVSGTYNDWDGEHSMTCYTVAQDGATVTYNYDPYTYTATLSGAATSVTLMDRAADDDDHDTGSTTESERNPDGSLTTTVTKPDGTTVETTRNPDGSKEVVETKKDGTVITTTTDKSGNETKTTENPDGTSVVSVTRTDGSTSATTVDEDGLSVTVAALSESAVTQGQTGTVSLPMPSVTAASDLDSAPAVTLDLPADTAVKVEIPVENVAAGTVAVLVKADGTSEIVKTSVTTEDGVVLTLSAGETVKIVDNTKTFADVADTFWGADAVAFVSSRELFNGTSASDFAPNTAMDRAMIVTVLARLDGVDTTAGSTWYEAGVQWAVSSGISDGSGLDQNLTREQLATMLYRYAQYKGYDVSEGENTNILSYSDVSSVSEYAMEAMQWACGAGIIGGKDGMLDPAGNATRAEVATMLMRFVALL